MRYYSTQRLVAPDTFPKPDGNRILLIHNYECKTYCEELGREIWGCIDYEKPLSPKQVASYELAPCEALEKILYFEGAGWSDADISKATIGNCRIRTAFHLDDGRAVYLEISGSKRKKSSNPRIYRWQYAGFVNSCFYITDDVPNDEENQHSIQRIDRNWVSNFVFEYTEAAILKFVNSLGASFTAIKVVPDLGGYRVFREKYSSNGPERYNYGDKFRYDPELIARREAVCQHYKELEESEGKSPDFYLWVVEDDPGALHLVRHFPGTFQTAHNTHWMLRVDTDETLEDWIATATETYLGNTDVKERDLDFLPFALICYPDSRSKAPCGDCMICHIWV